jgi:phosphohistidine phosphatase
MRRLFLIRHAKTEPAMGFNDHERALTERGRGDAHALAESLAARGVLPQTLIHSGARRAKETAEIFVAQWPHGVALEAAASLYEASPATLFSLARGLSDGAESVAFVGHNPSIGEIASILAGSGDQRELRRMASKFPTCAVAVLDFAVPTWSEIERNRGLLALYLTPSELEP